MHSRPPGRDHLDLGRRHERGFRPCYSVIAADGNRDERAATRLTPPAAEPLSTGLERLTFKSNDTRPQVIGKMPCRSQMLGHTDAAYEDRGRKRVLGLMIVEASGKDGSTAPNAHSLRRSEEQVSDEMLSASLPHRTPPERKENADGFLGVTTWQKVCQEIGLPWPPIEDGV